MPILSQDTDLTQFNLGTFGFTATTQDLESAGYTLADLVIDLSGSVQSFLPNIEAAVLGAIKILQNDPKKDSILIRITTFSSDITEVMGYKPVLSFDPSSLKGIFKAGGYTALFDAIISGAEAAANYGQELRKGDYDSNGILIVITDGENNSGRYRASVGSPDYDSQVELVSQALKMPHRKECLESYISVLVAVKLDSATESRLRTFHTQAGFTHPFISTDDIDSLKVSISSAISSQSAFQGTGGPSTKITF